MSSINVYEISASERPLNTISVWDASSTGTRPLNSIPVWNETNTGTKPLNSIQVKLVDKAPNAIPVWFNGGSEPGPGPSPIYWNEVKIGDQTWADANLAYDDGGEGILIVPDVTVNGVNFGTQYYYRSDAAMRLLKNWNNLPFNGWHIATQIDGSLLYNHVAGDALSLMTTSGWNDDNNGNNLNHFNGAPLGYYWDNEGEPEQENLGGECSFWLNRDYEFDYDTDFDCYMEFNGSYMTYEGFDVVNWYYPIRLIKD